VLASGNWYKIAVVKEGVYKVDVNFLNTLGISTTNLNSSSIQLFGNGGAMLPEDNVITRIDDLAENTIEMFDGGDGIFNGSDYFLFYGASADKWIKDSTNQKFTHQKNLYSDTVYYFITLGSNGKRINTVSTITNFNTTVTSFNERYFYENDKVNLLNSGKEWLGEEFSNNPGIPLSRSFAVDFTGLITAQPIIVNTNLVSRSIATPSTFSVSINNQLVQTVAPPSVSGYFLDAFATMSIQQNTVAVNQSIINLGISYAPNGPAAQGWLNWFEIFGRKNLAIQGNTQLVFRDWVSVKQGNIAQFAIANANTNTEVWDITNTLNPQKQVATINGSTIAFVSDAASLKEYIAFDRTSNLLLPLAIGKIGNQNLHQSTSADYLIIAHKNFLTQAQRLAQFHQQQYGYKVVAISTDQIYNEFAAGMPDATAIRDYIKMYYDKAGGDTTQQPKYVLLFGAASFDYKNRISNNTNFVPSFESTIALDPLNTYVSDDFFALLKDSSNINLISTPQLLNTSVGRLPARTVAEAQVMLQKIINYHQNIFLGDWKNECIFVADDKDNNLHLNDAEFISSDLGKTNPLFNLTKTYLDAYPLVSGSGGARYPSVNAAIVSKISNGTFLFNYSGHGGYQRLADEAILGTDELKQFKNSTKLPLFITATCDFAPFDDPTKNSLGGSLMYDDSTGAIALLTTTRSVFAFSNKIINDNYVKVAFAKDALGNYLTLGQSFKKAKNTTIQSLSDVTNARKFTLLGDPAMKLAFPVLNINIDSVNGKPIGNADTLKALNKYEFTGSIVNGQNSIVNTFNGTISTTIYDKPQMVSTLGNDPASPVTQFNVQNNVLFKGSSTVNKGTFKFSCIIPKDINYSVGKGKISLYAANTNTDANGVVNTLNIGSNANTITNDNVGPAIKIFLNDTNFRDYGLTNEQPLILVKLFDTSGINTTGIGIGHDITAVIDSNLSSLVTLNNYYQSDVNSYQSGWVAYQLPTLSEGNHYITIKAWDIANNSNTATLHFKVAKQAQLQIKNVYNYPNPFTDKTTISFEHNQQGFDLSVSLNIFSAKGVLVKNLQQTMNNAGNRSIDFVWDGRDAGSRKLESGMYFYRIIVQSINGIATATNKLFIH
jgi:hypothetical protein